MKESFRLAARRLPLSCLLTLVVLSALPPLAALAHEGRPPEPHDLWSLWDLRPIAPGMALSFLYAIGLHRVWRRAGVGRGVNRWQAAAFAGGMAASLLALVTPLEALGHALFSAHMAQHMLLVSVAAPLLVLGAPQDAWFWVLPVWARQSLSRWWNRAGRLQFGIRLFGHPGVAWGLHTAALWLWHAPGFYQAALSSERVHALEHAGFLGTGLLFWWTVLRATGRGRQDPGIGVFSLFTMALQTGALGALMTFAPTPWYPAYAPSTTAWGLTPIEDQQLAGLIMWIPAGMVDLLAVLLMLGIKLHGMERADAARSRLAPSRAEGER